MTSLQSREREHQRPKTAGEIGDVANGRIVHSIDDFHPAGIVNTIKSFALLGMPPGEGLIERLSARALLTAHQFTPSQVTGLLSSYAKLEIKPNIRLEKALMARFVDRHNQFTEKNLADLMWCIAKLKLRKEEATLKTFENSALKKIRQFTSRDLSVLLWSLATALVKPSNALVKAGIQQSLDMCKDFTPHELADATWAMGSMGWKPGSADTSGWFACIDEASDAMSFIDMMRTAWALTIIRIGGKIMSDGMLARLENGSQAFAGLSCKHFIMYLETLKRLGSVKPGPLLSNAILRGTVTHLDTFSSDQLLQVLDFMQCFEPRPEKQFLLNIVLKSVEKMFACTSKELVSLLKSATNLKLAPLPEAVEAYILRMAKLNLCRFKQSQAAIVRWAMTQLKIEISEDMMRELRCVESSQKYHLKTIIKASGGLLSVFKNVHRFNDRQRRHSMAPGTAPAPGRNLSSCIHDSGHERPMPNAYARRASVALSGCFIPLANDVSDYPTDKSSRRSSLVAATAVVAANKMSHSGERRRSSVSQMSGVERAISQPDSCNTDASMRKSSLYGQLWEGPTNRFIHRKETNKLLESEGIPLLSMPLPDAARGRAQVFKRPSSVEIRRPATSIPGCTEEGKDFLRTSSAPQRLKTLHQTLQDDSLTPSSSASTEVSDVDEMKRVQSI